MEAIEMLLKRRSIPADRLVEPAPNDEQLQTILTAGMRVPDHAMCTPWRVQFLRKEAQLKLGEKYAEIFAREHPEAEEKQIQIEKHKPQRAPLLLVVTAHPNQEKLARIPLMEQRLSGGAMCMNIINAANALGFGTNWVTGWPAYHAEVKKALGHSEDTEIIGFILVGTPSEPPKERIRPEYATIVSEWTG